ncbi:hypothetical protein [Robiginitalea sediminis]|uniref:hypothetical protein n=1 Tax=Robiginitalea sediminis TaxID=1982593 RepID=UPI000B4BAF5D|nr:hypothetical protein [Robiginitalea sediminis]
MRYKSIMKLGLGLLLLQFAGMVLYFYLAQPEGEAALPVFTVVPILLGANLLLGLLFYFYKRPIGLLFFGNAVLSSLLFFAVWIMWFTYWAG